MSKTPDIDATIVTLNGMLETAKSTREKISIIDRLAKLMALKYKFDSDKGTGRKFSELPEATNGNGTTDTRIPS